MGFVIACERIVPKYYAAALAVGVARAFVEPAIEAVTRERGRCALAADAKQLGVQLRKIAPAVSERADFGRASA